MGLRLTPLRVLKPKSLFLFWGQPPLSYMLHISPSDHSAHLHYPSTSGRGRWTPLLGFSASQSIPYATARGSLFRPDRSGPSWAEPSMEMN